ANYGVCPVRVVHRNLPRSGLENTIGHYQSQVLIPTEVHLEGRRGVAAHQGSAVVQFVAVSPDLEREPAETRGDLVVDADGRTERITRAVQRVMQFGVRMNAQTLLILETIQPDRIAEDRRILLEHPPGVERRARIDVAQIT